MEEKSLTVKKDNLFTKMANLVKRIFGLRKERKIENAEGAKAEDVVLKKESLDDEYQRIVEAYNRFENHELELSTLSISELENLNNYYQVKIADLSKKRDEIINKIIYIKEELDSYKVI